MGGSREENSQNEFKIPKMNFLSLNIHEYDCELIFNSNHPQTSHLYLSGGENCEDLLCLQTISDRRSGYFYLC